MERAAGVIPAAHGPLPVLLADVLTAVAHSGPVVAIQPLGGGEAKLPLRQIVHRAVVPPNAAVHHFKAASGHEAMEVESAVLVLLRDEDVPEAMPPNHVVAPAIQRAGDGLSVIAVNLGGVKSQGDKVIESVRQGEPPELRPGSPHAPDSVLSIGLFPRFPGRGQSPRFIPPGILPTGFSEDGLATAQHI